LALLLLVAVTGERAAIESGLQRRAADALARSGHDWASPVLSGRDIVLTGRASAESERRNAVDIVSSQRGVRLVEDRIDLIALATTYVWSATLRGNRLRISGNVPSEAMRKAVIGTAKANFPGREVDDEMQLARGAPDQDQWLGGVSFAMKQLARLKPGGRVRLTGTALTVEGEAADGAAYQSVTAALAEGLPQGISIGADKVAPPKIRPYTWSAERRERQLELAGHAPGERQRDEIFELAKQAFPSSAVIDRMSIAAGEPRGWREAVVAALASLAELEEGRVELTDTELGIAGLAEDQPAATAIGKALRSALPTPFKVASEQLRLKQPAVKPDAEAKRQADSEAEAQRLAALERQRAAEEETRRKEVAEEETRRREAAGEEARRKAAETEARAKAAAAAEEEARRKAAADEEARKQELARCREEVSSALAPGSVTFARARADLDRQSHAALDRLAAAARKCPEIRFEIAGHADAEGTSARKQRLSERRARAVIDYLAGAGIEASRMTAVGFADMRPLASNDTLENRARNRRIELRVQ
jgi:outer membrane protein OmpA-like peptidoglycan-associated protein